MNDLIVLPQTNQWQKLKALVLDSVSSPITKRVYNLGLDEFIAWYGQEPRPGFRSLPASTWGQIDACGVTGKWPLPRVHLAHVRRRRGAPRRVFRPRLSDYDR
jgi:predicted phosphoadenosine phosphosulfate sulfurtransferase